MLSYQQPFNMQTSYMISNCDIITNEYEQYVSVVKYDIL